MKKDIMDLGAKQAEKTMSQGIGGPFGAVIVKDGEVISVASNSVLRDNDPTAHAEANAIRQAGEKLGTYDLSGCELYATGYPCPMCLSAIIWANINKVYFCNTLDEASKIGFRDDNIYKWLENKSSDILNIEQFRTEFASELYDKYKENDSTIY